MNNDTKMEDYAKYVETINDAIKSVTAMLTHILDTGEARAFSDPELNALGERLRKLHFIEPHLLRVWMAVLNCREHYVISDSADQCPAYLDEHFDVDPDDELYWSVVDHKKKISIHVDEDGKICGIDDGSPVELPAWSWVALVGKPGYLCSTE